MVQHPHLPVFIGLKFLEPAGWELKFAEDLNVLTGFQSLTGWKKG
jgi:hypothetical protein